MKVDRCNRMVRIPNLNDDTNYADATLVAPPWSEGFYILVTGAATGTAGLQVAQVNVAYSYELQTIPSA